MQDWDTFDLDEQPLPSATRVRRVLRSVLLAVAALTLVMTVVI